MLYRSVAVVGSVDGYGILARQRVQAIPIGVNHEEEYVI